MKKFKIYHPTNGRLNTLCERGTMEYEVIGIVLADNLHSSFKRSQNDFNKEYVKFGKRSTSVGDIVYDVENETYNMILECGWAEDIPETNVQVIEWTVN